MGALIFQGSVFVKVGRFYFIKDEFFDKFDPNHELMQNKDDGDGKLGGRPCFIAFPDTENSQIFWLVPFSSQTEKYMGIVEHKAQKRANLNKPPVECDTIRFCDVLGHKKAFLIQNMFPITSRYISSQYFIKNTNVEVRIAQNLEQDIIFRAKKVLKLHRNGIKLIFGDIDTIYQKLTTELQQAVTLSEAQSVVSSTSQQTSQSIVETQDGVSATAVSQQSVSQKSSVLDQKIQKARQTIATTSATTNDYSQNQAKLTYKNNRDNDDR